MKKLRNLFFLAIAVALVAVACGGDSPEAGGDESGAAPSTVEPDRDGDQDGGGDGKKTGGGDGDKADPEDLAPDFSVETFDGETFTLSEHQGMPVVLNFWESW